jgi:hypothetical protein
MTVKQNLSGAGDRLKLGGEVFGHGSMRVTEPGFRAEFFSANNLSGDLGAIGIYGLNLLQPNGVPVERARSHIYALRLLSEPRRQATYRDCREAQIAANDGFFDFVVGLCGQRIQLVEATQSVGKTMEELQQATTAHLNFHNTFVERGLLSECVSRLGQMLVPFAARNGLDTGALVD